MAASRRKYTAEYRAHAVELVRESGQPIAEGARDLGVRERTVAHWMHRARQAESDDEKPVNASERAEWKQLRNDYHTIRMERDCCKRAAEYCASHQT